MTTHHVVEWYWGWCQWRWLCPSDRYQHWRKKKEKTQLQHGFYTQTKLCTADVCKINTKLDFGEERNIQRKKTDFLVRIHTKAYVNIWHLFFFLSFCSFIYVFFFHRKQNNRAPSLSHTIILTVTDKQTQTRVHAEPHARAFSVFHPRVWAMSYNPYCLLLPWRFFVMPAKPAMASVIFP